MSDVNKRRLIAIHEAGHAIVAQALGYDVDEIRLNGDGGGRCHAELPARDSLEAIEDELAFVLAGRLAVALAEDKDWRKLLLLNVVELEASTSGTRFRDYADAAKAFLERGRFGHNWMDKALPLAAEEAVRILQECWDDVQALAIRLDVRGEVDLGEKARRARVLKEIERLEVRVARDRREQVGARR